MSAMTFIQPISVPTEKGEKMSVIVKGMEMPKKYCYNCPLQDGEDGRCKILGITVYDIPKECPLVEVVERKKGKWVKQNPFVDTEECSLCKYNIYSEELETPFCPWCGAEMEEDECGKQQQV